MAALENDWKEALSGEFQKEYYRQLYLKIRDEYRSHMVYPPSEDVFNALHLTPLHEVKAVILGQDPYFNEGQAHGLCFSVKQGVELPPSLKNIYKEIHDDLGLPIPETGDLTPWAKQGVLLLNTVLTVRAGHPNSHRGIGWEQFTDAVIGKVDEQDRPIVFLLWGTPAQRKQSLLRNPKHLVLKASHPSPLSVYRGFEGCRHFSKTNRFLEENGATPIDWSI